MIKQKISIWAAAGLILLSAACTSSREREVEQEFSQYKSWVNEKTDKAENSLEAEWKDIKQEYDQKTEQLESKAEDLSAESKEEYKQLKARFNDVDARYQKELELRRQEEEMMNDEQKVKQWEQTTLGANFDLANTSATNFRDTYIQFMETVRSKSGNWTESDWQYADRTYSKLNALKDQLEGELSSKDELKIKALQAEFKTLQAASAAKDTYKDVKKEVKD